ncbi:hypothetical protein [Streptacidiphilus monticola]|uniref:Uncharacterized protein n=1 Tax=Streptacidiphilus monticola TaxID=2161674 RepID=A0ABW1FYP2_9ACTN
MTEEEELRSARLVAWGNAWFAGLTSPDHLAEAVRGDDAAHQVVGLPGGGTPGLTLALGELRGLGATGLRLALPEPGHPLGLTGPPEFNARAMEAGEAVLAVGVPWGLVPEVVWHGSPDGEGDDGLTAVTWHALPVNPGVPADVPALRDAERELAQGMREATDLLLRLDVAGAGPAVQDALRRFRRGEEGTVLAPGYPPRVVKVLDSARRVAALLEIAAMSEGAAVSAGEMAARSGALRPLARSARRAQVAAYNALVDEAPR